MSRLLENARGNAKVAEAALRNLYLDCQGEAGGDKTFASRMLALTDEGLVVDVPMYHGRPVHVAVGEAVTCSCRLGVEVLRFTAEVKGDVLFGVDSRQAPALMLHRLGQPELVQRRRYFRLAMKDRLPIDATIWPMEVGQAGSAHVQAELHGLIRDLSPGGAGVSLEDVEGLDEMLGNQLWVRFTLPAENESQIFRVEPRHVDRAAEPGRCLVGLAFAEFIEPGQHQQIIARLAGFVAQQQDQSAGDAEESE